MAPRTSNRNRSKLDAMTLRLLRGNGKTHKARQSGNFADNDRVRLEYAQRTNADSHDDKGEAGLNRGQNWTSESLPNPGKDDE